MTVSEGIQNIMGRGAGLLHRRAVWYAQSLIEEGETVVAAVTSEIIAAVRVRGTLHREKFPGVAVLTNRRAFAVCALPGIRRVIAVPRGDCTESFSAIRYNASFSDGNSTFSLSLNPEDGERFSRCVAVLEGRGEAFDAVDGGQAGSIFNPALVRNRRRARQTKEEKIKKRAEEKKRQAAQSGTETPVLLSRQEDAKATAARLAAELEQARESGFVSDADPKAVAARLAAELAEETRKDGR